MEAVETGPIEVAPGALSEIVTVISGWERVTNVAAGIAGRDAQSDTDYRQALITRSARNTAGPLAALNAALEEAATTRRRITENTESTVMVVDEWPLRPHSICVIAEGGTDGDVQRSVENHRGMGVAVTVAAIGGTPDNGVLDSVSDGTVTVGGQRPHRP